MTTDPRAGTPSPSTDPRRSRGVTVDDLTPVTSAKNDGDAVVPSTRSDGAASESLIRLDQFLKRSGLVGTGGQAKLVIQAGEVMVNEEIETRRRKKLQPGDRIRFQGREELVVAE